MSANSRSGPESTGKDTHPFAVFARVELTLFAVIWVAFGVGFFIVVDRAARKYDMLLEKIDRGELTPVPLRIEAIYEKKGGWLIKLRPSDSSRLITRSAEDLGELSEGASVQGYPFEGRYLILRFDHGGAHRAKWVFLALGLMPVVVFVLYRKLNRLD